MTTPQDPSGGKPGSDTLISDRPPIEDEEDRAVPFKSDEATAVNHAISDEGEDDSEGERDFDPNRTMPGASLYVDSGIPQREARAEISGRNAAAPVGSGPIPSAPSAPTLVHSQPLIQDDDDDDDEPTGDGATERLPAPAASTTAAPDTRVGPLPDRSPGASLMAGAVEPAPASPPQVQQWRVVPSGQSSIPAAPPSAPRKPRGLQTVLWSMQPMEVDDEGEEEFDEESEPYVPTGGTIARAAQTYVMEAIEMLDGLREFGPDLDDERGRELLSNITGCTDRLRRALALLATSESADDDE